MPDTSRSEARVSKSQTHRQQKDKKARTFRYGDRLWQHRVYHIVGQHQVRDRVLVDRTSKILLVAIREGMCNSVMVVDHAGDAIEAKAVETELLQPVAQVGKQEAENLTNLRQQPHKVLQHTSQCE